MQEKRNEFASPEQKNCCTWQIGFCGVSTQDTGLCLHFGGCCHYFCSVAFAPFGRYQTLSPYVGDTVAGHECRCVCQIYTRVLQAHTQLRRRVCSHEGRTRNDTLRAFTKSSGYRESSEWAHATGREESSSKKQESGVPLSRREHQQRQQRKWYKNKHVKKKETHIAASSVLPLVSLC